jgi:hypothetical protein
MLSTKIRCLQFLSVSSRNSFPIALISKLLCICLSQETSYTTKIIRLRSLSQQVCLSQMLLNIVISRKTEGNRRISILYSLYKVQELINIRSDQHSQMREEDSSSMACEPITTVRTTNEDRFDARQI